MSTVLALLLSVAASATCTRTDGDRIVGSDLARADARFASLSADIVVGFSPLPGIQRGFDVRALVRIARAHGIATDGLRPLCFERASEVLTEARLRPAMEALLPNGSTLEILDFSRNRIPAGELKFVLSDLRKPVPGNAAIVVWRGRVEYGRTGSVPIWAKVRVLAPEPSGESPPAMPAGLAPPAHRILRGDDVEVEVASGGVRLRFSGTALNPGRVNDLILVASASGKKFKARVQDKGKVIIDAQGK